MKKKSAQIKHHSPRTKQATHNTRRKTRVFKGGLGAGTLYAVVALLIVALGGSLMIGNITPNTTSESESELMQNMQPVIISPPVLGPLKPNLQLDDFPGVTYTPTPSPEPPPQPDQEPPGKKPGKKPGGSSSRVEGNEPPRPNPR